MTADVRVRVIACGNPDAGDDGVGLDAVRLAGPRLLDLSGVEVVEAGPGIALFHLIDGPATVLVVDAVRSRRRPSGELILLRLPQEIDAIESDARLSSHGFGLAETVGLASALGRATEVIVLGIIVSGAAQVGEAVSGPVAAALPALADAVVAETKAALASSHRVGGR